MDASARGHQHWRAGCLSAPPVGVFALHSRVGRKIALWIAANPMRQMLLSLLGPRTKTKSKSNTERGLPVSVNSCLAVEVDTSFASRWVTRELEGKIAVPHIEPIRPVQNPYVESFHGKLRDE
jgi:hypothetical protein